MIETFSFAGGIHPDHCKHYTEQGDIVQMPVPARVVIPVSQHIGKPARVIVSEGDIVTRGQKIAEAQGYISLPVHSSVNGRVAGISRFPHPIYTRSLAVIIESDGQEEAPFPSVEREYFRLPREEICDIIKDAGISGMGGACFPAHVKLNPPKDTHTVIINGCECEPYLTCDDKLMRMYPRKIVEGAKIIMHALSADRAVIAVEENKRAALEKMYQAVFSEPNMDVAKLRVRYPQGAEKQLIKSVLDRIVPSGELPFEVGTVVSNVGTAHAIYQAVVKGIPLTERVVTVTGPGVEDPKDLLVRIGTPISSLIEMCGGLKEGVCKVLCGGPMMGIAQYTLDVPVVKGTSGILALDGDAGIEERNCIRCGRCVDVCPSRLVPSSIVRFSRKRQWDRAAGYGVRDCMECGSCAYVCPSAIPIVQYMRWTKAELLKKR